MRHYMVLYQPSDENTADLFGKGLNTIDILRLINEGPDIEGFPCQADSLDHAAEQCRNAYPGADVLWVHEGTDLEAAIDEWMDAPIDLSDNPWNNRDED
jgi:hypothetical protein